MGETEKEDSLKKRFEAYCNLLQSDKDIGALKKRLEYYYNTLLRVENKTDDTHTKQIVEYVIGNMDDEEVTGLEEDILVKDEQYIEVISSETLDEHKKAQMMRMFAYYNQFSQLSKEQKQIATPMQEIVEKYNNFDFSKIMSERINGNTFCYKKGIFPIEEYRTQLEEIGEKTKGNKWTVSEDDGKLVIY